MRALEGVVRFVRVTTNNFNLGKREIFRHHTIMQRESFSHPIDIKGIFVFCKRDVAGDYLLMGTYKTTL